MASKKMKYVRLKRYNEVIVFPEIIEHSKFRYLEPISAGFCNIDSEKLKVDCFGNSVSLGLDSKKEDSDIATRQFFHYY